MSEKKKVKGVIVPVITPLTEEEKVDEQSLRRLINHLKKAGVHGIFVLGSTGEFPSLQDKEKMRAIEIVVDEVSGEIPVIAGVGDNSTTRVIERVQEAKACGADFVASTLPFYYSLSQQEIYNFYTQVVKRGGVEMFLYHIPQIIKSGEILPDTVAKLSRVEGIVGMKDTGSLEHLQLSLLKTTGTNFKILVGTEYNFFAGLSLGAVGGVFSIANIVPEKCVALYEAFQRKEYEKSLQLQKEISAIKEFFDSYHNWISAHKVALKFMGICEDYVASPLLRMDEKEQGRIKRKLAEFDIIER